ncbi:triose-phosphate isomerase [Alteromonas sp. 5E99-2]|uniref:triose-phosphate isomerase n=1 Tax=Alteromonas sp. 5E99-2 TaxID=2817683 RepID=UPI001F61B2FF|nr:triose-phosphate isomerase [Alteromonas sp. 5E99-2]
MARKLMVVGNWKMNGCRQYVNELTTALSLHCFNSVDVVVCPPACLIQSFGSIDFLLAGQDVSDCNDGAYTGDISAAMLAEIGCEYVLVGHSERREMHGETNQQVAQKVLRAIEQGIKPIVCVGEPLLMKEAKAEQDYIAEQLAPVLSAVNCEQLEQVVFAYEPIWAIGTGKSASPEQAQCIHKFIRDVISRKSESAAEKVRILYGGSVNFDNAQALFAQDDIDGGLVGGASLKSDSFTTICRYANGEH